MWLWPMIESVLADIKLALRQLRRSPGFTVTAVLTLALGIGANTAIFSVVDGILFRPLPVPHPSEVSCVRYGRIAPDPIWKTRRIRTGSISAPGLIPSRISPFTRTCR